MANNYAYSLTALTPLDGRYKFATSILAPYVSEYALIKIRLEIEIKYFMTLSDIGVIRKFSKKEKKLLEMFLQNFALQDAQKVKDIEKKARHDVKSVEIYLREKLKRTTLANTVEMIHFGLTSEDINNIAYRLLLVRATHDITLPLLKQIIDDLTNKADTYKSIAMLARTHGQAAVPTTLGKELIVFATRLNEQINKLSNLKLTGKLNGAVGNYNALSFTHPQVNWLNVSKKFISSLNLTPNLITTQINSYDDVAECFQIYERINSIIIGLDQDIWRYISDQWFMQEVKKDEVGSSTMPQKVNPIDFENSEGNLGLANSIFEHMAQKLLISRMQRDLSDSTVIRNIGTGLGFSYMGYRSLLTGLSRIKPDKSKITEDLEKDWSILTEGLQLLLRKNGVAHSYDMIKQISRGKKMDSAVWSSWIESLPIEDEIKKQLAKLTPTRYIGHAIKLTTMAIVDIKKTL